jgi:CMP-N-acetylneuraminic acid synthetase
VPHTHHAFNPRVVEDGRVRFRFAEERKRAYNKQRKPGFYAFGNVLVARSAALMDGADWFAEPSVAVEIPRPYDLDVDTADDLALAEALVTSGAVSLRHMAGVRAET